jgi:translation elongation factor EF-Tu-like GTPase
MPLLEEARTMSEKPVGHVTHWFGRLGVAGVHVDQGDLRVGDRIHVVGATSDFGQRIRSMELEHNPVDTAHTGEDVGILVGVHARDHDVVYKVVDDQ